MRAAETSDATSADFERGVDLVARIQSRELSARELMETTLARIARVDPTLNAIPTRVDDADALAMADSADAALAKGDPIGPLHGIPIAIKDLVATRGLRTTLGSPLLKDFVPSEDGLYVKRLREAGALVIGKTNVPEFGAGSHTFNPIFGVTRNPPDPSKSVGGSSGGAAAALASGMLAFADGSDMGGSLRNPAAFCGVVGFRPSLGTVPSPEPGPGFIARLTVDGAMGRSVADAAWLLSVMAGPDPGDPMSIFAPGSRFRAPLERDFGGARVAWGGDLGLFPVDPEVLAICEGALHGFAGIGARVEADRPDLSGAMDVFQTQRAATFAQFERMWAGIPDWRAQVKDTLLWNIDRGLALSATDLVASDAERKRICASAARFFETYDFLALPTTQVPAFDVDIEWVQEINGQPMSTYIDWMASCCVITVTGLPALSVPCGFTRAGLPVGLQIVGGPRCDFEVLQVAHAFEQAIDLPPTASAPDPG